MCSRRGRLLILPPVRPHCDALAGKSLHALSVHVVAVGGRCVHAPKTITGFLHLMHAIVQLQRAASSRQLHHAWRLAPTAARCFFRLVIMFLSSRSSRSNSSIKHFTHWHYVVLPPNVRCYSICRVICAHHRKVLAAAAAAAAAVVDRVADSFSPFLQRVYCFTVALASLLTP